MKRQYKTILLLLFAVCFHVANAQYSPIKEYSNDPVKFLGQLATTITYTKMTPKQQKEYMERFTLLWNSPKYSANMKSATYDAFNLMVKKKVQINPNYMTYLWIMMDFAETQTDEQKFEGWQNCVMNILHHEKNRNLKKFLEVSEYVLYYNQLYKTAALEYSASNNNFSFEYNKEAQVVYSGLNLRCFNNQRDSGVVYNTKGVLYPNTLKFKGEGGTVNWNRTGIKDDVVWAVLDKYEINLKKLYFNADSVLFYNKKYFEKPLLGILSEKVVSERGENISYPRFISYEKTMRIKEIAEGVDYEGGFSMRGKKIVGVGSQEEKAMLIFKRDRVPFLTAKSLKIFITDDKLYSDAVNVKFNLGKDSITHPSLSLKYFTKTKDLTLIRTPKGLAKSPLYNSYHKLNMYFERLDWNTNDSLIEMRMLVNDGTVGALFESMNYYRIEDYKSLTANEIIRHLAAIKKYIEQENDSIREFKGDDYARYKKTSPRYVLPAIVNMAGSGFLSYDGTTDMIQVNQKAFDYLGAHRKKNDFDVLLFTSFTRNYKNAKINLHNNDMTLYGVEKIYLSDSQNVVISPAKQIVVVRKNRNFAFAGVIQAGRFTLYGRSFEFDYTNFKIALNEVDSMSLKVRSIKPDIYGNYPLVKVKSVISDINGTLEIDQPQNKSGLKPYSRYPILTSNEKSYVYYDQKYIQRGSYKRNNFYFHLDPFEIDSLDNFSNEGIAFDGDMVSAEIFPDFREVLRLQPDYSLGFIAKTPANGYDIYGDKAKFTSEISLNNNGLGGDGTLKYITSTTVSEDIIFFPDSLNATAITYDVKEQRTKPVYSEIHGEDLDIHFRPYRDILYASTNPTRTTTSIINSHNKQATLEGLLSLTPLKLSGNGTAIFGPGHLTSKSMYYQPTRIDADTSLFELKSPDFSLDNLLAFSTEAVEAHIDFERRRGDFEAIGDGSLVNFPIIKYICFLQRFSWYMDSDDIEFGNENEKVVSKQKSEEMDFRALEFISTHEDQDSLRFEAMSAKFNPRTSIIRSKGVDHIRTADALVYPDSGKVTLVKNAVMKPLKNSRIAANFITKLHQLYKCKVVIKGRHKYSGSGFYDYIDEDKKKQTFYFSDISVDTAIETYAETKIPESLNFKLSPNFEFKGKVKLRASKNFLVFDGTTRIVHECATIPKTWFKFETEINPDEIYIPVIETPSGSVSMMITSDSIYSTFVSPINSRLDAKFLSADGFMFYHKESKEYRIANKAKLIERSLPGNYLSLNTKKCKIEGEGQMSFGGDYGQVEMNTFGQGFHDLEPNEFVFDIMSYFDFFFDEGALDIMSKDIIAHNELIAADYSRPVAEQGLRFFLGKELGDKVLGQIALYGEAKKIPDEMRKTFFFNQLRMKWNKQTRSFTTDGGIGIGNIGKTQVNKFVNGQVEIKRRRSGDAFTIYLQIDEYTWYFFTYSRGVMLAVSSNPAFNSAIKALKADKRKLSVKGAANYYFNICSPAKRAQFLRRGEMLNEEDENDK